MILLYKKPKRVVEIVEQVEPHYVFTITNHSMQPNRWTWNVIFIDNNRYRHDDGYGECSTEEEAIQAAKDRIKFHTTAWDVKTYDKDGNPL